MWKFRLIILITNEGLWRKKSFFVSNIKIDLFNLITQYWKDVFSIMPQYSIIQSEFIAILNSLFRDFLEKRIVNMT